MTTLHSDKLCLLEDIPAIKELMAWPQWVCWKLETRPGQTKPTKPPYQANVPDGEPPKLASSTDSATWGSLWDAIFAVDPFALEGIGFVLTQGDPYVVIDLDNCIENSEVQTWARAVIHILKSYTEVSPSGKGLHIFAKGKLSEGRRRKGQFEIYNSGRFITVTGHTLKGGPTRIEWRQKEIDTLCAQMFGPTRAATKALPTRPAKMTLTEADILERAQAASNGEDFKALWEGHIAKYSSPSEADMALVSHLAYWTGSSVSLVDSLFRRSGLMRPKWDERHAGDGRTYGEITIENVLATQGVSGEINPALFWKL